MRYTTPDYSKAAKYLELAMAQNYDAAFNVRANMLRNGQGQAADPVAAAKLYRKGLDLGNGGAGNSLAEMYRLGDGIEKDHIKSRATYSAAAATGYEVAIGNLGLMYQLGLGGSLDKSAAYALYVEAVNMGDPNSGILLSSLMWQDDGYWYDPVWAYVYCLWAVKHARDAQRAGFVETCKRDEKSLSAEQIAESKQLLQGV